MRVQRSIVEHVFGTIKDWMGRDHFRTRRLANVATEMSLHVLAYNLKRAVAVIGTPMLIAAMRGGEQIRLLDASEPGGIRARPNARSHTASVERGHSDQIPARAA